MVGEFHRFQKALYVYCLLRLTSKKNYSTISKAFLPNVHSRVRNTSFFEKELGGVKIVSISDDLTQTKNSKSLIVDGQNVVVVIVLERRIVFDGLCCIEFLEPSDVRLSRRLDLTLKQCWTAFDDSVVVDERFYDDCRRLKTLL